MKLFKTLSVLLLAIAAGIDLQSFFYSMVIMLQETISLFTFRCTKPERTKQMERILRAKVKNFFKSENLKKNAFNKK